MASPQTDIGAPVPPTSAIVTGAGTGKFVGSNVAPGPIVYLFLAALLVYLALAVGNSLVRAPWWDEGVFTDVALNFRNFGHLGSSVLAPEGYISLPQVSQYTYWQMPLYLIALGTWLRLAPFSIESVRLFSIGWGLLYIGAWFVFVRYLSGSRRLAFAIASLVALDYSLISAASDGRMDMMCASLGQIALAVYAYLRKAHLGWAVSLAAWFGAASLFCHPMGLLTNAFLVALVILDWRRIRLGGCWPASIPYLIGFTLCVRYVLQAPAIFAAQSNSASSYRISNFGWILRHIVVDFPHRYLGFYFFYLAGVNKLKVFALLFGLAGFIGILFSRRLRSLPIARTLLLLAAVAYLGVPIIDNQTFPLYFVYSMPFFTACGALWVYFQHSGTWRRKAAQTFMAASVAATIGGFGDKIYRNEYRSVYLPAVSAIKRALPPGGTVMGGSEMGFAFGFKPPLVDDRYLGFSSKISPNVYVSNLYYGGQAGHYAAWDWSRKALKSRYHLVFSNSNYQVFQRNDGPTASGVADNSAFSPSAQTVSK
ncbi:MAG: hypothetical protein JO210_00070 [Acidobacteriaceae bacterium]|nr:hypothetical protein [Acidobacteriaceae bacterium]